MQKEAVLMPSQKSYHHGNLRTALLDRAVAITRQEGAGAITLRGLARQVGVSSAAAYRHFANHAALMQAVKQAALARLADYVQQRLEAMTMASEPSLARAQARMEVIWRAYIAFATEEPGLFRIAFDGTLTEQVMPELVDDPAYAIFGQVMDELIAAGYCATSQKRHNQLFLWAAMHGLATLYVSGPFATLPATDWEALQSHTYAAALKGIRQ